MGKTHSEQETLLRQDCPKASPNVWDGGSRRDADRRTTCHERAANTVAPTYGRRLLLLPLLLALGIFSVSSLGARFLAPRGVAGRAGQQAGDGISLSVAIDAATDIGRDGASNLRNCTIPVTYAMQGVDVVAYFSLAEGDEPVFGSTEFGSQYGRYLFLFHSAETKATFEADPEAYLPAWGGFCSKGIALEDYWTPDTLGPPVDVSSWLISPDGRLRFFRSDSVWGIFLKDFDSNVASGDAKWTSWFGDDSVTYPFGVSCFCAYGEDC